MRFLTAHIVVLATASYVLATPAPSGENALSSASANLSIKNPEHRLQSAPSSPVSPRFPSSPLSPLSPKSRMFKGAQFTAPQRYRKASRKYCKGSQRHAILCSQKSSEDLAAKLLKRKSPAVTKELTVMLDLARAFMEEHGAQTAVEAQKHKQHRVANRKSSHRLEAEAESLASPVTPKPNSKTNSAKVTKKAQKLVRRHRRRGGRCRNLSGQEREDCRQQQREKRRRRKYRHAPSQGQDQTNAPAVVTEQPSADAQRLARRSVEDEMMLEKRFFTNEIDELD